MKLFSYCLRYDDGAAPNPFWGICTLTICKPAIRRTASIGDWVVGTGSKKVRGHGDLSNRLVYAMKITDKKTLKEYDSFCREKAPKKIPDWEHRDYRRRLGDCLYDYSTKPPIQRKGVHNKKNVKTDLSGKNSLISNHFYYFGDKPIAIPESLKPIVLQRQGHRKDLNETYIPLFLEWIEGQNLELNTLYGNPQLNIFDDPACQSACIKFRATEIDIEEKIC
ncbi:MAG: hypothetical protein ACFFAE_20210 [Candidatus Hodarchaeota archaeon]